MYFFCIIFYFVLVIFKLMTTGSWLMAQLDCLYKFSSLHHFYHNAHLWPVNIHQIGHPIENILWTPSSLRVSAGPDLFDEVMDNIMVGMEFNRDPFGVHGVLPVERANQQPTLHDSSFQTAGRSEHNGMLSLIDFVLFVCLL